MRKKVLAILALTILVTSTLVGCSGASPADSTLTILSITEGTVLMMKAGTDDWIEATVEMPLEVGDTIKTGGDSGAEITFFDGSTIELEAGTQIEITSLESSADTGATTITLMQTIGTTISRVTKLLDPASTYAIETPSGVAAVRGSVMIVRIVFDDPNYEDGTVPITCVEGDIWAIWNGVELHIPEGYTCVIRPGQPLELIPPNEPPEPVSDNVTDEDTSNGQPEEPQPGGSATDWLTVPPPPVLVYIDFPVVEPPANPADGGGTPPTGNETTARIEITIDPGTGANVFIWDDTIHDWAVDEHTHLPVNGQNQEASAHITVAGDHHYYVYVYYVSEEGAVTTYYDVKNSHGWTISPAPEGGEQADGVADPGSTNPLQFEEIQN
jgi:hypothetical protein